MKMIQQILQALQRAEIAQYYIDKIETQSAEVFFVRRNLDLKRRTDVTEYTVTVYHVYEQVGQPKLGASNAQIYPGMEAEEIEAAVRAAYHAAGFAGNPSYELYKGTKEEFIPSGSSLAGQTLEETLRQMTDALFAADVQERVFINSAEVFAKRQIHHTINSNGVDVSFETYQVSGEYVVQCTQPQDVETYHSFSYREADAEALRKDVEEALVMTEARANATQAPAAGAYRIILSGEQMATLLDYYVERSASSMVYQQYSNYQVGMQVQGTTQDDAMVDAQSAGENAVEIAKAGDLLTIILKAKDPYSNEGIPMKDRVLMEKGLLQTIHGGNRFAQYLGIEPTGFYNSIEVPVGEMPLDEMKKGAYLHSVSFSDFQMDSFSGHFGGEIRLAFLSDGSRVIPVTGGSVNGSVLEMQDKMVFSKERYKNGRYDGPMAVCLNGVQVAGV